MWSVNVGVLLSLYMFKMLSLLKIFGLFSGTESDNAYSGFGVMVFMNLKLSVNEVFVFFGL